MDELELIRRVTQFLLVFMIGTMVGVTLIESVDWNVSYKSVYWSNNSIWEKAWHMVGVVLSLLVLLGIAAITLYTFFRFVSGHILFLL